MAKRKSKFMCQDCGYESPKWMGKCPGCGAWNKMVEEVEKAPTRKGAFAHTEATTVAAKPMRITDVEIANEARIYTDSRELDRVLGGGIVEDHSSSLEGIQGSENLPYCCKFLPNWLIKNTRYFIFLERNH